VNRIKAKPLEFVLGELDGLVFAVECLDGLPTFSIEDANIPVVADFDHIDRTGITEMGLVAASVHRLGLFVSAKA
jgi:hypothetical protein